MPSMALNHNRVILQFMSELTLKYNKVEGNPAKKVSIVWPLASSKMTLE